MLQSVGELDFTSRTGVDGLERIEDEEQLNELRAQRALVAVPVSTSLRINEDLSVNRRYVRPWTSHFLADLGRGVGRQPHAAIQFQAQAGVPAGFRRRVRCERRTGVVSDPR